MRQYVLAAGGAARAVDEPQSMAARQLQAARDAVADLDYDVVGPVMVFYLAGAGRDVRARRAAEGLAVDELQARIFAPESGRGWGRTDAQVGEQIAKARDCEPGTWHVERAAAAGVLAVGVDTLYASADTHLAPSIVEQLEALRTIARESRTQVYIGAGAHLWKVEPYGRFPYCVVLRGKASTIMVKRGQSTAQNPQAYIEFRSDWLWRDGPEQCVATVAALLRRWTDDKMRHHRFKVAVSRIDMAVDIDGQTLNIRGDELLRGRWLTRARGKSQFYQGELQKLGVTEAQASDAQKRGARAAAERAFDRARQFAEFWQGVTYTGIAMGKSGIGVRIYRKDIELKRPGIHKPWMRALWRERGWDGNAPVWRVEFTIMGTKLRELASKTSRDVFAGLTTHLEEKGRRAGRWIAGTDWDAVKMSLGALWRVCAGDPRLESGGWLSLRDPTGNQQRTRWPVNAGWRAIQAVGWQLGGSAMGLDGVHGRRIRKERHDSVGPEEIEALTARPAAWAACQPIDPGGDPLADALEVPGAELLRRWGYGPVTKEDARAFDVEVSSAESRLDQIMPQLTGCLIKVMAELKLSGEEHSFDAAMMRVFFDLPENLADRVDAKAAATAINAARQVAMRRAA